MAAECGFERAFFLLDRGLFQGHEGGGFIDLEADEDGNHYQHETQHEGNSPAVTLELFG
ncbi:hypothetical protein D3C71_2185560 [compost metagenome]